MVSDLLLRIVFHRQHCLEESQDSLIMFSRKGKSLFYIPYTAIIMLSTYQMQLNICHEGFPLIIGLSSASTGMNEVPLYQRMQNTWIICLQGCMYAYSYLDTGDSSLEKNQEIQKVNLKIIIIDFKINIIVSKCGSQCKSS